MQIFSAFHSYSADLGTPRNRNQKFIAVITKDIFGPLLIHVTSRNIKLYDRGSRVRFPAGAGNFFLHHRVQNGSGADPASYPMGARISFPGGKAAGA
jgi:hypothetical protein